MSKTEYCSVELDESNLKAFVYAIKNHYWYQMYIGECLLHCTMAVLHTAYVTVLYVVINRITTSVSLIFSLSLSLIVCILSLSADDLPLWGELVDTLIMSTPTHYPLSSRSLGIVGDAEDVADEKEYIIMTHKKFDISYNGDQVCQYT